MAVGAMFDIRIVIFCVILSLGGFPAHAQSSLVEQQKMISIRWNARVADCLKKFPVKQLSADALECTRQATKHANNDLSAVRQKAKVSMIEDLSYHGYANIGKTYVPGSFEGCGLLMAFSLEDGSLFICDKNGSSTPFEPQPPIGHAETLIMKHVGSGKIVLVIANVIYEGSLYRTH